MSNTIQTTGAFTVQENTQYYIKEKPTSETDDELRKLGRSKRGAGFGESAGCTYDVYNKRYDHGLDANSKEFQGMSDTEVKKILGQRKSLIKYFEAQQQNGKFSEDEIIAKHKLFVKHEMVVNTSNISDYFRLYLAMRGTVITPPNGVNNFAKYGNSMYILVDEENKQSNRDKVAKLVFDVTKKMTNMLAGDEKMALEVLRYVGLVQPNEVKEPHYLLETVMDVIKNDFKMLEKLHTTLTETDEQEILAYNRVTLRYIQGRIKKDNTGYTFNGEHLGISLKLIANSLIKDPLKKEIAIQILEDK